MKIPKKKATKTEAPQEVFVNVHDERGLSAHTVASVALLIASPNSVHEAVRYVRADLALPTREELARALHMMTCSDRCTGPADAWERKQARELLRLLRIIAAGRKAGR